MNASHYFFFLLLIFLAQFDHVNAGLINATSDGTYTNDPFGQASWLHLITKIFKIIHQGYITIFCCIDFEVQ